MSFLLIYNEAFSLCFVKVIFYNKFVFTSCASIFFPIHVNLLCHSIHTYTRYIFKVSVLMLNYFFIHNISLCFYKWHIYNVYNPMIPTFIIVAYTKANI